MNRRLVLSFMFICVLTVYILFTYTYGKKFGYSKGIKDGYINACEDFYNGKLKFKPVEVKTINWEPIEK